MEYVYFIIVSLLGIIFCYRYFLLPSISLVRKELKLRSNGCECDAKINGYIQNEIGGDLYYNAQIEFITENGTVIQVTSLTGKKKRDINPDIKEVKIIYEINNPTNFIEQSYKSTILKGVILLMSILAICLCAYFFFKNIYEYFGSVSN